MNRTASAALAVLMCCLAPLKGLAQQSPSSPVVPVEASGVIDLGGRGTLFANGSDEGRFNRYRDLRNGGLLDSFRYDIGNGSREFTVRADHIGYRDQRYVASYSGVGRLKASFQWDQTPMFLSDRTSTLYSAEAPGVLRIDDTIQRNVQTGATTLAAVVGQAQPFDLRARRDVLDLTLSYRAAPDVDLNVAVKSTTNTGNQPWAGTFGFGNVAELAAPLDTRTTEVGTSLEWAGRRGVARVGYDGSYFRNHVDTLVWDNPLRITDSPAAGPSQGRMARWPDNNLSAANATGLLNLPHRSRATAYLSIGRWTQDDPLIPFTINAALPVVPLDRQTADARALVTAMSYGFTSRPTSTLWVSTRYRSYDFDNRTPLFSVMQTVVYDTRVSAFTHGGTSPYSFARRTFDADSSYTPAPFTAVRVGYTREQVNQTFRTFDTTVEDTLRVSADTTRVSWLTLRGEYRHGVRTGSGLDEQTLDDIGEQTSLRQFDISDRTLDRASGIIQVTPFQSLAFSGSLSAGKEARSASAFGLRSSRSRAYSAAVDYMPRDAVSAGVSYTYERYTALQASRQANPGPQFSDPTRDWTTDSADWAHTVTAGLDLIELWPTIDLRLGYDYSRARSLYTYALAPGSPLGPVVQLPAVVNDLRRGTVDARHDLTNHLSAGVSYWFDRYSVEDFALGAETLTGLAQPTFLTIGYLYRPYTAHTVMGRMSYRW